MTNGTALAWARSALAPSRHRAIVHVCTEGDEVLVGMGAIVLDGAEIGARSIIGAGALVTGHRVIPPGSLVLGSPVLEQPPGHGGD